MTTEPQKTGFELFLADLDPLVKSMAAGAPAAAATLLPGQAKNADGTPKVDGDGKPVMEAPVRTEEPLGKSFRMKLEDGTEVDALDGTEMMKALQAKNDTLEARCATLESALTKSLEAAVIFGRATAKQDEMLKALKADVERLGAAPGGRRAVLAVVEKGPTAGGAPGVSAEAFGEDMMKAFHAGKLTAEQVNMADYVMQKGLQPDAEVVKTVLSFSGRT